MLSRSGALWYSWKQPFLMSLVAPVAPVTFRSLLPESSMNLQGIMMTHDLYEAVMYFLCQGEFLLCLSIACQHLKPPVFHAAVTLKSYSIQSRTKSPNSPDRGALCSRPPSKTQYWVLCVNNSLQKIKHLLCFPDWTSSPGIPCLFLLWVYCNVLLLAHWHNLCLHLVSVSVFLIK